MAPKVYMIFTHTVWDSVFPGGVRVFLGWLEFVLVCIMLLILNVKLTMRSEKVINIWFVLLPLNGCGTEVVTPISNFMTWHMPQTEHLRGGWASYIHPSFEFEYIESLYRFTDK